MLRPILFVCAALLVAGLALALAPRAEVPPFNPMGGQAIYRPTDSDARALVEPWLHAPWRGPRPIAAGALLALTIVATAVPLSLALGATPLSAWLTVAAMLLSAPFAATVRHAADAALLVVFVWTAWGLAVIGTRRRDHWMIVVALAPWLAAMAMSWVAMAFAPVLLLAWMHVARTPRNRLLATLVVAAVAVLGLLVHVARTAGAVSASAAIGGVPIGLSDVWTDLFERISRVGAAQFAPPDLSGPSILSLALAAVAVAFCPWPRWLRLGVLASAGMFGVIGLQWPVWRPEAMLWASWLATPLVAAGLAWAVAQATPRWRTFAVVAAGVVLVGSSVAAARRPLGSRDSRAFANQVDTLLRRIERQGRPIALVAEDTLVDSALAAWSKAPRVSQRPEAVTRVLDAGIDPLAGPEGRGHLELFGFRFETLAAIDEPAPYRWSRVAERFRCATTRIDRWSLLPGVEYTGRLGLDIPPTPGARLLMIVGDDLPLQLRATLASGQALALHEQPLLSGPGTGTPPPDYWFDGGDPALAPQKVVRLAIPAHAVETTLVSLYLGRRAPRVLARLEGYDDAARGRVCAAPIGPDAFWGHTPGRDVDVPLDAAPFFGVGWHGVEGDNGNRFRWTTSDAAILVPSAVEGPVTLLLDAAPAVEPAADGPMLTLTVNGRAQAPQRMRAGVTRYEWPIGRVQWIAGTNELLFSVSHSVRPAEQGGSDTRVLGLRVHGLTLSRR